MFLELPSTDGHRDLFVLIAGEPTGITLVNLRDRFEAARKLSDLLETLQSADLEALRSAYREFAYEFWTWREKNSLDKTRVDINRLGGILPMFINAPMQIAIESMLNRDLRVHVGRNHGMAKSPAFLQVSVRVIHREKLLVVRGDIAVQMYHREAGTTTNYTASLDPERC